MYVLDCVCLLAPAPVLVVGGVLKCSPACACACVCVCQSVARSCVHVSLHVHLHVCGCVVWIVCASYELLVCALLVYATTNTCGNNATDEKLKIKKKRRV